MALVFKNDAKTTLSSGINSSATSLVVQSGAVFPSPSGGSTFFVTLDDGSEKEVVSVTARSGNTLTIVRGRDNTTARAYNAGDLVELRINAGVLDTFPQVGTTYTAVTQAASDNSTKVATTAYTTTAVANLVDGAPAALNTLNEIAAALNDDAALNTTLTNSIATKLPLSGGTMTGNIAHAGTFTIDVGGEIILDADGGKVRFKDAGTDIGFVSFANTDLTFYSSVP